MEKTHTTTTTQKRERERNIRDEVTKPHEQIDTNEIYVLVS